MLGLLKARSVMLRGMIFGCVLAAQALLTPTAIAAKSDPAWRDVNESSIVRSAQARRIVPTTYRTLYLDRASLQTLLAAAPLEAQTALDESTARIALPMPDGSFSEFQFVESPIMEPGLASKFPELKTYLGQGIDDPTASVRFDMTPQGFHAQIISWKGTSYIDPYQLDDDQHHIAYHKADAPRREPLRCLVTGEALPADAPDFSKRGVAVKLSSGAQLRSYRLAIAATGEYTSFHGGTVNLAMAAITTTMNRVNGIYERDLAVRMLLVANNNLLIYTNAATDPFTNGNPGTMIGQNQTNTTAVIGAANYDIGHVVATNSGGLAGLGVVCNVNNKARGVTGSGVPVGDAFDVNYVAHEMGHQFGGDHSFNGCDGNRNAATAYEPASGSTIQAYAGICGSDDLQPNSDDYFHRVSLNQMLTFVGTGGGASCDAATATNNSVPTVTTTATHTIPKQTPFTLTAAGADVNGDTLTYTWEQFDLGSPNPTGSLTDTGSGPLFRSFAPTTSPSRTFPQLARILNFNNTAQWELLPNTSRTLNFRVTVRDNRANGGGTNEASSAVTVSATAGPFVITAPNTAVSWNAAVPQTVTWNVDNTTASPVSTANVRILLSLNGGTSFPIVLASNEPNDGSASVVLVGSTPTTQARIRLEAVGSIYFDISNTNFTITGTAPSLGATIVETGGTAVTEGANADTYTIALTAPPTADVILTPSPNAQLSVSPATLTFTTSNWASPRTVTVTAINDDIAEGTHNGVITHAATGGGYTGVSMGSVTATITDNDTAGANIVQAGGTNLTEGGNSDTYTVVLTSQPTAAVSFTASPDAQVSVAPATLSFNAANWAAPQTITVTAVNDAIAEGTHNGVITHAASGGGYNGVVIANVAATISDNDTVGTSIVQAGGTAVTEDGTGDTYTIALTSQPTGSVTLTPTPDAQLTVTPPTLSFNAANWAAPQTVTVSAVNDTVTEGTHNGVITHAASGGDYNGVSIMSVTATIADNDTATLSSVGVVQAEGNSGTNPMQFTVQLAGQVANGFTVSYVTRNDTAIGGEDYVTASGTLSFDTTADASRTFSIGILGDLTVEPNEGFFVDLTTTAAGVQISPAAVPGEIVNDDTAVDAVFASGFESEERGS